MLLAGSAVAVHFARAAETAPLNSHVTVTADRVAESGDGTHIDVVLRVSAGAQDAANLSVFWMIAPPGVQRPWDEPRYVAAAQTLSAIPARATRQVEWIGSPLALPQGSYEITAWVHQILASGETEPLAGGPVGRFSVSQPPPETLQLTENAFNKPIGPLVLESLSLSQESPSGQFVSVEANVRNRGSDPVEGRSEMVVSRFADPEPFRSAFWQTDWQDVAMLNPGQSGTLRWTSPVGLPAGTYGLSVWLHARIDSNWEHSHATFNIPLELGPNLSRVQRARPPASSLEIKQASLDESRQVRLIVDNQGPDATVSVGAELLPERRRFDWHLAILRPREALGRFVLAQHAQGVLQLPVQVDCASEDRFVHLTLFPEPLSSAPAEAAPLDDVLVDACG